DRPTVSSLLSLLAARMPAEVPRRAELAELVPHHLFRDEDLVEDLAVVDLEGRPDELRHDRATTRPGPDRRPRAALLGTLHLEEQLLVHERAFFQTSSHVSSRQNRT